MNHHLLAQSLTLPGEGTINGPLVGTVTVGSIIGNALPLVLALAGIGLFLMIVASGFGFLTSAGDAKKIEQSKLRLTNALIGFIIIFAAFWLVQIVGKMFGLETVSSIFGN